MPNWNQNKLILTGPAEDVQRLLDLIGTRERPVDYSVLLPEPSDYSGIEFGEDNLTRSLLSRDETWMAWRLQFWGTQWNADAGDIFGERTATGDWIQHILKWDSAWAPPLMWLIALVEAAAKYLPSVDVRFASYESGMYFAYEAGKRPHRRAWVREVHTDKLRSHRHKYRFSRGF